MRFYTVATKRFSAAVPRNRGARRRLLCWALFLLLGLAAPQPCRAEENALRVITPWVRPGPEAAVSVRLPDTLDATGKKYLRLNRQDNKVIKDFPLAEDQVRRGLAEAKVPEPLRWGIYTAQLVSEDGDVLASGDTGIKVAVAQAPVIRAIQPAVAYPKNGRYDFEILGDNFSDFEEGMVDIRINGSSLGKLKKCGSAEAQPSAAACDGSVLPCMDSSWRSIRLCGVSLDPKISRPLSVKVEVGRLGSEPQPLTLSAVQPSMPRMIAYLLLLVFLGLAWRCRKFLFIDTQTNTYSLSNLQLYIWGSAASVSYAYLVVSQLLVQWKLGVPNVPEGLPMLLGISTSTIALAVGATGFRGNKGAGTVNPAFTDFVTVGGVFAPERLQFFLWTIFGAATFVGATLAQDPGTVAEMAKIPDTFNQLMGASTFGYLAGKYVRKGGPVIKEVVEDAAAPPCGIRIIGENLSPSAEIMIDDKVYSVQKMPASQQGKDADFVSELQITLDIEVSNIAKQIKVAIKNPDGQSAEKEITIRKAVNCPTGP